MELPTKLYAEDKLDHCVKAGRNIHSLRYILEPAFFTTEIHYALLSNYRLRRDIEFSLQVFDDYAIGLNAYYYQNHALREGFTEVTLFNLIARVSAFCQQNSLQNWFHLFMAKKYAIDLFKLNQFTEQGSNEIHKHLLLAQLTLGGLRPYYEISFPLPLSLPIDSGTYPLSTPEINYFKVQHFKDSKRNSMFGDRNFSHVTIAFWGILETIQIGCLDLSKCISLVNEIMTAAKLVDEKLRVFMLETHNLYSYQITQYRSDGILLRKHLPVSQLTTPFAIANDDDSVNTHQKVMNTPQVVSQLKKSSLFIYERLYANALIDKGNNNYTSSFYQLNSSIESLISHSLRTAYLHRNKLYEFELFMYGSDDDVPNNFKQLKELRKQLNHIRKGSISVRECQKLESYLKVIKGQDEEGYLRNRLVHGAEHKVDKKTLTKCFEAYKNLKQLLIEKLGNLT